MIKKIDSKQKKDFDEWIEENKSQYKTTVADLRELLDPFFECNLCKYFDSETEKCSKNKRPKKYTFLDGPNTECYAHLTCLEFIMCKTETDTKGLDRFWAV